MTTEQRDRGGAGAVLAVVGPTASGKSELALRLAERLGGEIVGADASQLYRGMDIGTAKLTPAERRGIRHHQLDVLEVTEEASVAAYQREARADVDGILGRGAVPIVAGGSGLYVRALLDRLEIPPTDAAVRARWAGEAERVGAAGLVERLRTLDAAAASAIEPGNTRRLVRALEVIELTGRPFSATLPTRQYVRPTLTLGLLPDRATLDERIDRRVEQMWADGLVDEVRGLVAHGLREGRTASRALGYAQVLAQLGGDLTEVEAIAATATATRRFARRQLSWFRPDPRIVWADPADAASVDALVTRAERFVTDPERLGG